MLQRLFVLLIASQLVGCGLTERFDSPEARINAAIPLDASVQSAHAKLVTELAVQSKEKPAVEQAWAVRLRLRANSCSRDFSPTWRDSKQVIRERLANNACFGEFDRTLHRWLGLQRVRLLLAQGPVRPTPSSLPERISHDEFISTLIPAAKAPVAFVRGATRFDVIDLTNGSKLFSEPIAGRGDYPVTMSPNGRLFAETSSGGVTLRATEGGERLVELPKWGGLLWLGANAAALRGTSDSRTDVGLLDLTSGDETPITTTVHVSPYLAVPVSGSGERYNLVTPFGVVAQIELFTVADRIQARVLKHHRSDGHGYAVNMGGLTSDGLAWVDGSNGLRRLNMDTLEFEKRDFAPAGSHGAYPLPNPGETLIAMHLPTGDGVTSSFKHFVYAHADDTLAEVQESPGSAVRYQYINVLKRLASIERDGLRYMTSPPTTAAVPAALAVSVFNESVTQRRMALEAAQAAAGMGRPKFSSTPAAQGPQLQGIGEVKVEGVGVYEGAGARHGLGQPRSPGAVEVIVRRTTRPLALVLTSYEPVNWRITLMPGAELAAVLVSGYYESRVTGAGDARVVNMGRNYAYERNAAGYADLQRDVTQWVGRPMSSFQGRYKGGSFTVGGM